MIAIYTTTLWRDEQRFLLLLASLVCKWIMSDDRTLLITSIRTFPRL